ncbi:hypothetical protein KQI63_14335 [bacterium]|nr:hypothetical protein [bacterium]
MKKMIFALFFILPLASFAGIPHLPEGSDAQKRYAANHLRVNQTYPTARLTSRKSHHWTVFQGDRKLTENEFFTLAGRPDLVVDGRRNVDRQERIIGASPAMVGFGVGAVLTGIIFRNNDDAASKETGTYVSVTGAVMAVSGIWGILNSDVLPGNSFEVAVLAANEFNDRLMMSLLLESQQQPPTLASPAGPPDEQAPEKDDLD